MFSVKSRSLKHTVFQVNCQFSCQARVEAIFIEPHESCRLKCSIKKALIIPVDEGFSAGV